MKKMKRLLALVLCASIVCALMFVAAPTASAAGTVADVVAAIEAFNTAHGGNLTATLDPDDDTGTTVIVDGSYEGTATLELEIDSDVTVFWQANFTNTGTGAAIAITGDGTLNITAGTISTNGTGGYSNAIYKMGGGDINVIDGTVTATGVGGNAIRNGGAGTVTISGGTVSTVNGDGGHAIWNNAGGNVNVSGTAEVSAVGTAGTAIYNDGTGAVNVTGGTVTANGTAIYSTGAVNVSGNAVVTANNAAINNIGSRDITVSGNATVSATVNAGRAIHNNAGGAVNVSGTAEVTATTGTAIYNNAGGTVTVSGTAEISATTGTAIYNNGAGTVNVSGGLVQATTGRAINNFNNGPVNVRGGTVQATTGQPIYNSGGAVTVSGGLVQTTDGRAILNVAGTVNISGGLVQATTGLAIRNDSATFPVAISDTATVFAYGAWIDDDVVSGLYYVTDSAIVIAWDTDDGTGEYAANGGDISIAHAAGAEISVEWVFGTTPETTGFSYNVNGRTGIIALNVTKLATRRPPIFDDVGTTQETKEETKDDTKEEPETPATTDPADVDDAPAAADVPFADVAPSAWYAADVAWVYERGLFGGTSATTFAPNSQMTRAMVFTVLARLAGVETEGGDTWYALALEWGVETGLTDGLNPTGNVTREQLVTLLWRYAGSPTAAGTLDGFTDADSLSSWASDAMAWAVSVGIIRGNDSGTLNPQGDASRAEVAAMLRRFVEAA